MDPRTPSDGDFELLPSAEPGGWQFRVARSDAVLGPDSGIAAGTTYTAATGMAVRPRVHIWGAYVAAQVEPAGAGHIWQYFVRALPTLPSVAEGPLAPIWGRARRHTYLDLISATRPDRADMFSTSGTTLTLDLVAGGTWDWVAFGAIELSSVRPVLDVEEKDLGNGLCEVTVITVDNPSVQKNEDVVDPETGQKKVVSKIHVLHSIAPIGFGTRPDSYFAEVAAVEHNHWLMVVDRASALPMSRDAAPEVHTTGPGVYWPAVLESYLFTTLAEDDRLSFKKLLTTNMRDPYGGDVKILTRKWQSATPVTIDQPVAMIANSIKVPGHRMSFSIPECLHGDFTYSEQAYDASEWDGSYHIPTGKATGLVLAVLTFRFTATEQDDWPETITRIRQVFERGVYLLTEEIFHRPKNYNSSQQTFSSRPWTIYDPWEMPLSNN